MLSLNSASPLNRDNDSDKESEEEKIVFLLFNNYE